MKKWQVAIIIILILSYLTYIGVDSRANFAIVDKGDEIYLELLSYQELCYATLETYAQDVRQGRMGLDQYQVASAQIQVELSKYDDFILERQSLEGAPPSEIADFYREVFGWGLFPTPPKQP